MSYPVCIWARIQTLFTWGRAKQISNAKCYEIFFNPTTYMGATFSKHICLRETYYVVIINNARVECKRNSLPVSLGSILLKRCNWLNMHNASRKFSQLFEWVCSSPAITIIFTRGTWHWSQYIGYTVVKIILRQVLQK